MKSSIESPRFRHTCGAPWCAVWSPAPLADDFFYSECHPDAALRIRVCSLCSRHTPSRVSPSPTTERYTIGFPILYTRLHCTPARQSTRRQTRRNRNTLHATAADAPRVRPPWRGKPSGEKFFRGEPGFPENLAGTKSVGKNHTNTKYRGFP